MCTGQNIFKLLNVILPIVKDFVEIVLAVIGGYCAVKGISFLQTLKEKKTSAIFTFWSQLSMRILELLFVLQRKNSIINGLYSERSRSSWSSSDPEPTDTEVNKFYLNVKETLLSIKTAPDQMPAYPTWMDDYLIFTQFLIDVVQFDITDLEHNFMDTKLTTLEERNKYCENVCKAMNALLNGMKEEQTKASIAINE